MCKAARVPVIYHYRPSPRLVFCGWTPFPTLSISDAERRAYHNRRVSDARYPQRIFDTLWILVRSDWSRLGATGLATDLFRTHGRSQQAATLLCLFSMNALHACLARKKNRAPAVLQMLCFIVWFEGRGFSYLLPKIIS